MDFQSRINQFRQGLKDQQDSYNSLAQSSAQYGRSIIPDKVAQHLTYMEQVGGMITGASAGLHGAVEMGKKINKFRVAKQLKNNPTGQKPETQQGDQSSKSSKQGRQELNERQAESQTKETTPTDTGGQTTARGGMSEAGGQAEDGGIRVPKLGGEEEDDDLLSGLRQQGVNSVKSGSVVKMEQGEGDLGPDPFADVDFSARGTSSGGSSISRTSASNTSSRPTRTQADDNRQLGEEDQESGGVDGGAGSSDIRLNSSNVDNTGGNIAPKTDAPTRPNGTAEGDGDTISDSDAFTRNLLGDDTENLMPDLGDVADAVKSGVSAVGKKIAGGIGDAVGEIGGEAIASSVPVLGELVGLGLLIRNVIEHHKHEENAPPPQLTAPNPEATEQSGGFSDAMLKGSVQAPSIV